MAQLNFEIDAERRQALKILGAQLNLPVKALLESAVDLLLKNEAVNMLTQDRVALDATSRRQWDRSAALKSEFKTFEAYAAWRRAVVNGQCPEKIKSGPVISATGK
jgi:hypothetical protein